MWRESSGCGGRSGGDSNGVFVVVDGTLRPLVAASDFFCLFAIMFSSIGQDFELFLGLTYLIDGGVETAV